MGKKIIDKSVNTKDPFKSVIIKIKEQTINLIRPSPKYFNCQLISTAAALFHCS